MNNYIFLFQHLHFAKGPNFLKWGCKFKSIWLTRAVRKNGFITDWKVWREKLVSCHLTVHWYFILLYSNLVYTFLHFSTVFFQSLLVFLNAPLCALLQVLCASQSRDNTSPRLRKEIQDGGECGTEGKDSTYVSLINRRFTHWDLNFRWYRCWYLTADTWRLLLRKHMMRKMQRRKEYTHS